MHYYKKNIGDYAKQAGRLSMLEHGAYTLLLDTCYDREQFPTEDEAVDWCWARTEQEVAAVKFVLSKFFTLIDGVYVQKRVQEELTAYQQNVETNTRIATEREAKRKGVKPTVNEACTKREPTVNEAPPNQEPRTINHKPITNNQSHADGQNLEQPAKTENPARVGDVEVLDAEPKTQNAPNPPTMAGAICVALRANGAAPTEVNPANPTFLRLIAEGATIDHFVASFAKAKDAGAGKPFAYMLSVVAGDMQAASNIGNARASPSGLPPNKQERLEAANQARADSLIEKMKAQGAL